MKKKLSILLAMLLWPSVGCGAAVYYNDPSCAENGNGTSFMCAESAGAAGAYNTWAGVTFSGANYYLQKAGETESAAYINIAAGGTDASNHLVIGSYTTGGALTTAKAYLDGAGNGQDRVINCPLKYHVTIQDLDITYDRDGEDVYAYGIAIPSSGGDTATDYDNIIQRVKIHDIKNGDQDVNKVASGIVATYNGGLHLIDVEIDTVDTDCVQGGGNNLEISGGTYQYSGGGTAASGDELQVVGDDMWIHGVVTRHLQQDEKQNVLFRGDRIIVEDSFFYGYINGDTSASLFRPVYLEGDDITFRRNYVEGTGVSSILYAPLVTGFNAHHNTLMVYGTATGGVSLGGNDSSLYNNTIIYKGTAANTVHGVKQLDAVTGGIATNNIFFGFATGVLSTHMADSYNDIYGATKECADSFGTERACGTGTITVDPVFDSQGRPTAKTPLTIKRGGLEIDGYASYYIGAYPYYEGTITPWNIALSIMGGPGRIGGGVIYNAPVELVTFGGESATFGGEAATW